MNQKVITNYRILNPSSESGPEPKPASNQRVIAQARISETAQPITSQREKNQPKLDVVKNAHGVITALIVTCGCGEEITLLLDYE
jgi:hypothetical protein